MKSPSGLLVGQRGPETLLFRLLPEAGLVIQGEHKRGGWTDGRAETRERKCESHLEGQSEARGLAGAKKREKQLPEGRKRPCGVIFTEGTRDCIQQNRDAPFCLNIGSTDLCLPATPSFNHPLIHWTTTSRNPPCAKPTCPPPHPPAAPSPVTSELALYATLSFPSLRLSGQQHAQLPA